MSKNVLDQIPKNIKKLRLLNHMTQADVATALNLDTQYYAQLERGERNFTVEKIIMLCSIFKTDINSIITIDTQEQLATPQTLKRVTELLASLNETELLLAERIIIDIIS